MVPRLRARTRPRRGAPEAQAAHGGAHPGQDGLLNHAHWQARGHWRRSSWATGRHHQERLEAMALDA
eukprot:11792471-Heterocapsa_arctica.AAC.1